MTALVVLYMVDQLLLPGHVEHIAGFANFRAAIESVVGPLSPQALASQIYGLYAGFVYFTPVLGGLIADRWMRGTLEAHLNPNLALTEAEARDRLSTHREAVAFIILVSCVLFAFVTFAFVFRGGLSYALSGIALVHHDGRRATRLTCACREFVIWFPLVLLLVLDIGIQSQYPEWLYVRLSFAIGIGLLLIAYLVIGVVYSNRGPHDELVGTHMVPA